jgi:hypothetical protein
MAKLKELFAKFSSDSEPGNLSGLMTVPVIRKKINEAVLVSVDLQGLGPAVLAGFNLYYQESVIAPVLKTGSVVNVDSSVGDLWAGFETDLITNRVKDDDTNETFVAVSRVVKMGDPPAQDGRLCTMKFQCKAHGTSSIILKNRNFGLYQNGDFVAYQSDAPEYGYEMQPEEVPPPVYRVLCVVVVE